MVYKIRNVGLFLNFFPATSSVEFGVYDERDLDLNHQYNTIPSCDDAVVKFDSIEQLHKVLESLYDPYHSKFVLIVQTSSHLASLLAIRNCRL